MKASKLVVGESYRHKDGPSYYWATVLKVLGPKQDENPHKRIIVKCVFGQSKDLNFGLIKYFRPSDLMREGER